MAYNVYPAVDNVTNLFPPVVMTALGKSAELKNTVIPMSQADRNNLAGAELWNGRLIFNTTTNKINRYNSGWYEIDKDVRTDPLTLPGAPTLDLHAATKNYVDTHRAYPGRNRIINGDFSVNQRAFTSTTTSATFGFDRWSHVHSGGTVTCSAQTATLGELPESAKNYTRLITASQAAIGDYAFYRQKIESVRTLSGQTSTISFWAKAETGTPKLSIELTQTFGTTGSPSADVRIYAGQVTLSTVWTRYSLTVAIPSISDKVLGIDNNDALLLYCWTSAGSTYASRTGSLGIQNVTIDFWGIQLEEGSVATPFEQKPYADELRACQRYLCYATRVDYGGLVLQGQVYTAGGVGLFGTFPVPMRIAPTVTWPAMTNAIDIFGYTTVTPTLSGQSWGLLSGYAYFGGMSGLTIGYMAQWYSTNKVFFSAEL